MQAGVVNASIALSDGQGKAWNIRGSASTTGRQKTDKETGSKTAASSKPPSEEETPGTEGCCTPVLDEMPPLRSWLDRDSSNACITPIDGKVHRVQGRLAECGGSFAGVALGKDRNIQAILGQVIDGAAGSAGGDGQKRLNASHLA